MDQSWLKTLKVFVKQRPLALFRFEDPEWWSLQQSRHGVNEFTCAKYHELVKTIQTPCACLIFGGDESESRAYFGILKSKARVTTLDSRVRVSRSLPILPSSTDDLLQLVTARRLVTLLQKRLDTNNSVILLSPQLSVHLVEILAAIETNHNSMRTVSASLSVPKYFREMADVQEDAVQTVLRTFGLSSKDRAVSLVIPNGRRTALERVIIEDYVIGHDAKYVPGFDLVESNVTGWAVFEKNQEKLEVYTANRGPLERVFGVDLIYLNATRQNLVMVQYKMLEPIGRSNWAETDWIYRPDAGLASEIERMRRFSSFHTPGAHEYRLNSQVFYLKFVKRNGALKNAAIVMPIDHFECLRGDPSTMGPQGGFRVSFESLSGRYLRQGAFLDLIRSGYIGAHAKKTFDMRKLVQHVVQNGKSAVAAIQSLVKQEEIGLEG